MKIDEITNLFNIGRKITEDSSNPYLYFAKKYNKNNYRLITSGELIVRGKNLDIPEYIKEYIYYHQEALMIANMIEDKAINIIFRSISTKKEFMKLGNIKSSFYGIGELSEDFRYGTPILLVEGHLDRDMMAILYKNTLGVMTSTLSNNQVEILKHLTNKFILMLDNDEAGIKGTKIAKTQLKGCKISEIIHDNSLKDAGDLVKLLIKNPKEANEIINLYKNQILLA